MLEPVKKMHPVRPSPRNIYDLLPEGDCGEELVQHLHLGISEHLLGVRHCQCIQQVHQDNHNEEDKAKEENDLV